MHLKEKNSPGLEEGEGSIHKLPSTSAAGRKLWDPNTIRRPMRDDIFVSVHAYCLSQKNLLQKLSIKDNTRVKVMTKAGHKLVQGVTCNVLTKIALWATVEFFYSWKHLLNHSFLQPFSCCWFWHSRYWSFAIIFIGNVSKSITFLQSTVIMLINISC